MTAAIALMGSLQHNHLCFYYIYMILIIFSKHLLLHITWLRIFLSLFDVFLYLFRMFDLVWIV